MNVRALDAGSLRAPHIHGESPAHVVVIAGSAGALPPLRVIVDALPPDLDAAVLVIVHYPRHFKSLLAEVLARTARIAVVPARDGERIEAGRVYVAPSGHHHLVLDGLTLRLRDGTPVHRNIPAADPLFGSAALSFGCATIGAVLSGANANGAAGLRDVKEAGGSALVQLPSEAQYDRMPKSALALASVDLCAPAHVLAERIVQLCAVRRLDSH